MKPIVKTHVTFGLVTIPVRVYSAHESCDTNFNLLHEACGSRIKQKYVCENCDVNVSYQTALRGHETEKGNYVTFTKDELSELSSKSQALEIKEFVPVNKFDKIHFERTYYLEPDKHADHAYCLLRNALKKEKVGGIGQFTFRSKDNLVLVVEYNDILVMHKLHYAQEIRPQSVVNFKKEKIAKQELDLALQIIRDSKSSDVDLSKYENSLQKKYRDAVRKKEKGSKDVVEKQAEEPAPQVQDLMEQLKKSIEKSGSQKSKRKKKKKGKV